MRSTALLAVLATAAVLSTGCAAGRAPVTGFIYTDVKDSASVTGNSLASKRGTAQATSILGWVGQGDASAQAAAQAGGIKKISHVDYHTTSILGVYAPYTTDVYGE